MVLVLLLHHKERVHLQSDGVNAVPHAVQLFMGTPRLECSAVRHDVRVVQAPIEFAQLLAKLGNPVAQAAHHARQIGLFRKGRSLLPVHSLRPQDIGIVS